MKKYSLVSVSAVSALVAGLLLGASSVFAASLTGSLTSSVGTNIGVGGATGTSSAVAASSSSASSINENSGGAVYESASTTGVNGGNGTGSGGTLNASINIDSDDPHVTDYAQSIAENDPSVSAISATDDNVSISYRVPVKLFGFIPISETETASVDTSAQGSAAPEVSVSRPWWSFLASGNDGSTTAAFSSALNARLNVSASDSSQAQIMSDIESAAQQSSVSGSAAASGNASASTGY